jgi:hypothetical protein
VCSLDYEPCTLWRERVVVARRPHACDACWRPITPQEPYTLHKHLFEGSWSTERICATCWLVREAFAEAHRQTCAPSVLIDTLRECIDENGGERQWRLELAIMLNRRRHMTKHRRKQ